MKLGRLAESHAGAILHGPRDLDVAGLAYDSRAVERGFLFAALRGEKADGLDFAASAKRRGAVAILAERPPGIEIPWIEVGNARGALADLAAAFFSRPADRLALAGVTGTNGKTTTAFLIDAGLRHAGHTTGLLGTVETRIASRPKPASLTTPESLDLQRLLAEMVSEGVTHAALEVSSHALVQERVRGLRFKAAVFTNLTRDHLDYHQTMEAYAAAKARLFHWEGLRAAVINHDDAFGRALIAGTSAPLVLAYGLSERPADLPASVQWVGAASVQTTANGMSATLALGDERLPFATRIIGRHNLSNLLAVAAVLVAQGLSPAEIVVHLARLQPPAGRMACQGGDNAPLVVVDYAHTPDALTHILAALRDVTTARGGRLICVFGCGGDRDPGKRPEMGRAAALGADNVVVTSDNPRWETPDAIIAAIVDGAPGATVIEDRAEAIATIIAAAAAEDVVLLAGKGHEQTQEIRGQYYPFDDAMHARKALAAWRDHVPAEVR